MFKACLFDKYAEMWSKRDLIVCFYIPADLQAGENPSVGRQICLAFSLTLQLILNRTSAESFTLLLYSLAILISHTHLWCSSLVRFCTFPLSPSALSRYLPWQACLRAQPCEKPVNVHLLTNTHMDRAIAVRSIPGKRMEMEISHCWLLHISLYPINRRQDRASAVGLI